VLNIGSDRIGGFARIGNGSGFGVCSEQSVSHGAGVQGSSPICRRFGGGSARNRALVGGSCNSMHFMQLRKGA
jgi:hypothetical protein